MLKSLLFILTLTAMPLIPAPAQSPGDTKPTKKQARDNMADYKKAGGEIKVDLPPYSGPKRRVAVADMEVKIQANISSDPTPGGGTVTTTTIPVQPPADFGTGLTEMLNTALNSTKRFVLLERSDKGMVDIMKEQSLAGTDPLTRAEANKLMGAEIIVRGAVTEFTYRRNATGASADILKGLGIGSNSVEAAVALDIRMYDTTTGEIVASERADGHAKSSSKVLTLDTAPIKFGGSSSANTPLAHATREAIQKAILFICRQMASRTWEARIAKVVTDEGQGTELYTTIGTKDGFRVGDEFEVYHPGKIVTDPDNPGRVILRTRGVLVGRCKIVEVQSDYAICKPVTGEGFADKDVIRLPAPPKQEGAGGG